MRFGSAGLVLLFIFGALVAPLAAEGQQGTRLYHVGILTSDAEHDPRVVEVRDGLRALGYIEGRNLVVTYRWADGHLDRLPALAAEVVTSNVDVIVTIGSAVWAAKQETSTVPIVIAFSGDSVATGVVSNLARPGGNITGLTFMSTDLAAKRLELLKEAFPRIARIAVLYNPTERATEPELRETETAARMLGVTLQLLPGHGSDELERLFAAATRERADALLVPAHGFAYRNRVRIVELASQQRRPAMYGLREFVEAGGLMSYGPNVLAVTRRAATYVDRILKGTKPGDLPVEQPTKFELVINLKTAKALGLTIPPSLLGRADEVIQ
jgi:putative ABC transport system substrate-binding protein